MKEIEIIERMLKVMTEIMIGVGDGHSKLGEPAISLGYNSEGKWWAEVYSYVFDFGDGSRHHLFEANSYDELIEKILQAIEKYVAKEILEEVEIDERH